MSRDRLLALLAFVVLAGLVPYNLVDWRGSTASLTNAVLASVLVVYSAARLCWTLLKPDGRFLSVICFVFIYVFVGIASLAQVVARQFPLDNRNYSPAAVTHQLVLLLIGCVALELGMRVAEHWSRRRASQPALVREPGRGAGFRWTFSPGRTVAVAVIGLLFVGYQVATHGVQSFFVSREQTLTLLVGGGVADSGQPLYNSPDKAVGLLNALFSQYFVFLSLVVILYCRRSKLWSRSGPYAELGWRVLILLLVIANVIMNNPIGNARFYFCLVLVAFTAIYLDVRRPANLVLYTAGALFVLLFAFTYLDAFRTTGPVNAIASHTLTENESYPVLQMGLNGDLYVQESGHTEGRQLAGALLSPVPRRFWVDKPDATGHVVEQAYNRSTSAWTEMYVDFGAAGIVGFFLLYGFVLRCVEESTLHAPPGALTALFPLIGTFQLFLLRGSFQPAIGTAYQLLFVVALMSIVRPARAERVIVR